MSLALKSARAATQGTFRGQVQAGGLGGFLKGVARGAAGFLVGGPAGAAAAVLPDIIGRGGGSSAPPGLVAPPPMQLPVQRTPGILGAAQRFLPGGRTGYEVQVPANGMGCPKGYKPNKTEYFLKDGTFVPKGSRCVKIRRRNPLNPRAADRAMSRLTSAKKAAQKLNRVTIRKKKC